MNLSKTLVGSLTLLFGALIAPSTYAATPPALSNPVVGAPSNDPVYLGSMQGSATVSAGGNASYVIPLELPPGTRGIAPQLSLNYNSNMKNGLLGLGWFMQGASSAITRCPQNLSQDGQIEAIDYSATDRFCMDGHRLLVVNSGTYGSSGTLYRTEHDNFSRVESIGYAGSGPEQFEVRTKGGLIKTYGATSGSRIEAEGESTVRVWALSKVEDQTGNYYSITYHENNTLGEYYPTQIDYTANDVAGVSANASVEFVYEARTDTVLHYEMDTKIARHPKRMTNVKAYSGLNLVSDYRLEYEEIGVDSRSRITEIKRCDGAGLCQDPLTMEWWDDGVLSYSTSTLSVPYYLANSSTYLRPAAKIGEYGVPRWHDMNGDGTPDYVHIVPQSNGYYSTTSLDFEIMMSGPSGYSTVTWNTTVAGDPKEFTWADMNGDGRTDVMVPQGTSTKIAFSTPTGFDTQTWNGPSNASLGDVSFTDMNGDGLLDRVTVVTAWPSLTREVQVYLSTGTSFGAKQVWKTALPGPVTLRDLNGDGMTDVLNHTSSALRAYFSNGTGVDAQGFSHYVNGSNYPFGNYNGDGLSDRRAPSANSVYVSAINTGSTFHEAALSSYAPIINLDDNAFGDSYTITNYNSVWGVSTTVNAYLAKDDQGGSYQFVNLPMPAGLQNKFNQWYDLDGDGLNDFSIATTFVCRTSGSTSYYCEDGDLQISTNDGELPHLLKSVTNGLGTKVEFTYKPLTDHSIYTKGTSAVFPDQDIQDSRHVVTHIERSDGIGGVFETDYTYEGLKQDRQGRGQLGFAKITAKDLDQGMTTITDYAQAFPYASHPTMTEVRRTSDNRLLSSTDTTYSVHGTIGSGPVFPYVDNRIAKAFDLGDGRLLSTNTTTNHCDAYGNITDTTVETVDHENSQTFKNQTLASYTVDASSTWRIAQLNSSTVKAWLNGSYNSALDRTTTHTYDSGTGLRSSSTRQPGGGTGIELTTTLVHDTHGNVTSETVSGPGIASRASTIAYDSQGQFPLTMTNALGHAATLTWNADFGTKATQTDINGKTASWTHNTFGQQTLETRPDGTTTSTTVHEYSGSAYAYYVEVIASGTGPTKTYYDSVGRKKVTFAQSFTGTWAISGRTEYDSKGRISHHSEPYFLGSPAAWNFNSFDDLNRLTAVTAADPSKSSTTNYDGFSVAITDALSRTSTRWLNAAGQIIQSDDHAGTTMKSTYDPVGNRTQVTNAFGTALQSSVTYTYDRLGRMLTQNDPDHGVYTYTYDALGQKKTEQSPKMASLSQTRTFAYDLLGRTTSRAEPEGTATWTYDNTASGNLGKGQLHSESQFGLSKTYTYNSSNYGRLTRSSTVIDGSTYNHDLTYNGHGQVDRETFPSGFFVERTYNALGFLERVQHPSGPQVYYQMVSTDAAGRMTSEWRNDGSLTTQSYDGTSSRIAEQHAVIGVTDLQHFSYNYDSVGNMTSRSDVMQGLSETFTFDNLDRLTSGQVAGATTVDYAFDRTGNITEKSDMGDPFLYTTSKVHAVTQITVGGTTKNLSYDNNGNLSNGDDLPTVTWSSYNKPTQLVKGGVTYDFSYGTDRRRYKKVHSGGDTTHYIGSGYEKIIHSTSTEDRHYIKAYGRTVMVRKSFSTGGAWHQLVHYDHLGSVTLMSWQNSGAVRERYSYDAWGKRRNAFNWTAPVTTPGYKNRGYTGHEHLDDIGVIHMNGRIYSPKLGRMLSPDPVTQAPENGQNYNRYTYAFNNPLKYTDPSGYVAGECDNCEHMLVLGNTVRNVEYRLTFTPIQYADPGGNRSDPPGVRVRDAELAAQSELGDGSMGGAPAAPSSVVDDRGGIDCSVAWCVAATGGSENTFDNIQTWLAVLGLTPAVGIFADGANTLLSAIRANWIEAGINAAAMLPFIGQATTSGKLAAQLSLGSARSVFTSSGRLTQEVIENSRKIIDSSKIGNKAIPDGFSKYTTQSFQSPQGNFQAHFYKNDTTGEIFYGADYKIIYD